MLDHLFERLVPALVGVNSPKPQPVTETVLAVFMGKSGGGGSPPPPPPPPKAAVEPFEVHGLTKLEAKQRRRRKGSASALVIPRPQEGVGPYGGGGLA